MLTMKPSKLYVPNPQKWVHFFDKVADGQVKLLQSGGGQTPKIMPLGIHTSTETDKNKQLVVETVSPAEQSAQQAKSELERDNIKPRTIVKMNQNRRRQRRRSNGKIVKISRKQTGGRKKIGSRQKHSSRKKQTGGRKRQIGGRKRQTGGRKYKKPASKAKRQLFNF